MKSRTCLPCFDVGRLMPVTTKCTVKVLVCFLLLFSTPGSAWSEDVPFFQDVTPNPLEIELLTPDIVERIRPVIFDLQRLAVLDRGELVFNVFDDTFVSVSIVKQDRVIAGQTFWQGQVSGVAHSSVLLVSDGESLSGEIVGGDFHYQIRPWKEKVHIVREIASEQSSGVTAKVSGKTAFEAEVIVLTNHERRANSLSSLSYDANLTTSARAHAIDMAVQDYFAHNSLDGRTPFQRISAAGYQYNSAGENIAAGYTTAAQVVLGWMNSPGHRANILSAEYCDIGVGYAYEASSEYGAYWAQNFGRKQGVSVCPAPSFPPAVTTQSANDVQASRAVLNGLVNPNGQVTSYFFQYGLTSSYGYSTPTGSVGSGETVVAVNTMVWGLKGSTEYHYRLVATNDAGTSYGGDQSFGTGISTASRSLLPLGVLSLLLSNPTDTLSE